MKKTLKRMIAACIVLVLTVSMFATLGLAESTVPDGVKEAAYTNDKKIVIDTTYNAVGGVLRDNPYEVSSQTYYYWDDTYVYVWMDVYDGYNNGAGVVMLDVLYFRAGTTVNGAIYAGGGGEWCYNKGNGAITSSNESLKYAVTATPQTGVRSYEFRFPHGGQEGFLIHPVVYGAADYIVSYKASYQDSSQAKAIEFADESTWFDDSATQGKQEKPKEPSIDGVKEEAYTDDKSLTISTCYAGDRGAARENPYNVSSKTYYYWDDNYVYVWYDVFDPQTVVAMDVLYFNPDLAWEGAVYQNGGGAFVYNGNLAWDNNTIWEMVAAKEKVDGVRSYEMRIPRPTGEGFVINPVVYGAADYTVTYKSSYQMNGDGKVVKFNDESTWKETVPATTEEPDVPDIPVNPDAPQGTIDGLKESAYTDDKSLTISTAYAGDRGAPMENTSNLSSKTYYYWDDEYVYVWWDVFDANNVVLLDNMYFNPDPTWEGAVFQNGGGAIVYNNQNGSLAWDNSAVWSVVAAQENAQGVRSYEMRFPRPTGDGFMIDPVLYVSGSYTVSYKSSYQMNGDAKTVKFDDDTTWKEIVDSSQIPDKPIIPDHYVIDGVKEDAYTVDKMIEVSTAYAGQGGLRAQNTNHIYSRTYYYWDDTYVYLWWDIYDPDGIITIDAFYFLADSEEGKGGAIFQQAYGGQTSYYPASGQLHIDPKAGFQQTLALETAATRSFEMAFEHGGRDCFMINPVSYVSGTYTVSYGSSYLMMAAAKKVIYADPSTYTSTDAIDENVVTDYSKLDTIAAAIEQLPADAATLTEDDRALFNEVKAIVETVASGWLNKLDPAIKARYDAAVIRMRDLDAIANAESIEAVEAKIAALPDEVDLSSMDAVIEAKEDFLALGELSTYVDAQLQAKLSAALVRVDALRLPVAIDGKKDAAYEKGMTFEINQEFNYLSSTTVLGIDPVSYGLVSTYADDEYIYLYVEVFAKNFVTLPDGKPYSSTDEVNYDGIITYINPDPLNDPAGDPGFDSIDKTSADTRFGVLATGLISDIYKIEGINDYLWEPGNIQHFTHEKGYGYEARIPRVEGEDNFKANFVIVDPAFREDGSRDDEASRFTALGGEWAYNYLQWGEFWFEDFEKVYNYAEIEEMIAALPDPETIEDKECEEKVNLAKDALNYLNEEQKGAIAQASLDKLEAVLAALENVVEKPDCVYGDVNGDGNINAEDALWVLQAAVSKRTLDETQTAAADVDGSGSLDAVDALMILQKAVNKIEKFPVEA